MNATGLARELLELLLPRACLGCGDRVPPEDPRGLVCSRCVTLLRRPPAPRCSRCDLPLGTGHAPEEDCLECSEWPESLRTARAAVILEPPADALVHALKYGGWRPLGSLMAGRMGALAASELQRGGAGAHQDRASWMVVPVPTTRSRARHRGYNQAAVLAEEVARRLGLPLVHALERPGGRTQVRLGPMERRANVQGTFRLISSSGSPVRDGKVILIDDVLTTGATAGSAAEALAGGGAGEVHLVTFARSLPFGTAQRKPRTM